MRWLQSIKSDSRSPLSQSVRLSTGIEREIQKCQKQGCGIKTERGFLKK
jgi:hypothetical protein